MPGEQIAAVRQAIQSAESSQLKDVGKLNGVAASLEKSAAAAKSAADASRLQALVEILKNPER